MRVNEIPIISRLNDEKMLLSREHSIRIEFHVLARENEAKRVERRKKE